MPGTVHVIGAGLAGLAAAIRLASRAAGVSLHEAAGQAGGRCRSYHDPALDMVIDNGNHLVLSGNSAALAYLDAIHATETLAGPEHAEFAFVDFATGERWVLRIGDGPLPWWVFDGGRRVPGTKTVDYLALIRMLWATEGKTICETIGCTGPLYERFARPLWLAALNTVPQEASAQLAAAVTRATLGRGGKACRPLIACDGLGNAFVEPALRFLRDHGVPIAFGHRLRALSFSGEKVSALEFGEERIMIGRDDCVILAVPPVPAAELVPALATPTEFRAIVNAHFRIDPPASLAPITGIVNGTIEWVFGFKNRISVTISAADRLLDTPREALARKVWQEVAVVAGLPGPMPPWQIVRERRATFAATPAQNAKRPPSRTGWRNLFIAGDWTDTGLPATIEGAVQSGNRAADLAACL
ncbi:MAG TPA: hydroxysqualene dehydroxylase HpnE [Xanthobacteraceae bacterium]